MKKINKPTAVRHDLENHFPPLFSRNSPVQLGELILWQRRDAEATNASNPNRIAYEAEAAIARDFFGIGPNFLLRREVINPFAERAEDECDWDLVDVYADQDYTPAEIAAYLARIEHAHEVFNRLNEKTCEEVYDELITQQQAVAYGEYLSLFTDDYAEITVFRSFWPWYRYHCAENGLFCDE